MPNATLKFDGREIRIGEDLTTIGRASDNTISFAEDSNISRYHVEIENRGDAFYLLELGSSNGTTVNGERVSSEKMLNDGDVISLGNSSVVNFHLDEEIKKKEEQPSANANSDEAVADENSDVAEETETPKDAQPTEKKFPTGLAVAGATCGLAMILVVGAVLFSLNPTTSGCQAKAKITNLESNDVLRESKEIEVELEDETGCVSQAIFLLNDKEFARSDTQPFSATLDPNKFSMFANGENTSIKIVLEDSQGKKIQQSDEILLVFETKTVETPKPVTTETIEQTGATPTPKPKPTPKPNGKVTAAEAQTMVENLIKSMGGSGHKINKEFVEKVLAKTNDYTTAGGFSARAQGFQDVIKVAFTQNTDVGAPLGFLLAMNRTQFNQPKQGTEFGLWRMSNEFATQSSLTLGCGSTETLADNSQICAAKASATYTKLLLRTVFEGDPVYTAAAYGMSVDDAYKWRLTLPADRAEFWNAIKTPAQRDELVKFFAAGIVADNPQKFGLKDDRSISSLY